MEITKKKINVLILNDHLGWGGKVMHGVAKLFLQWIPAFNKDRFHVSLCLLRKKDPLSKYFIDAGIDTRFLGKGKFDPTTLLDLMKIIREESIDLIHAQQYGSMTFARLAKIFTGVPIIVHFHDMISFYPWFQRAADSVLARLTDAGLAVSHSVKKFQVEDGRAPGLDPQKIVVMHNCVPLDEFNMPNEEDIIIEKKRLGIEPDANIVGTVTRLYDIKGNEYIIKSAPEVLEAFPKTVFLIVGDGPLRRDLEELAGELGIRDRVIFTGFSENVPRLMGIFDVKVFSSWRDGGSPLPVLEAMAMGKPIVATDIVEVIEDGLTGLVVPTKNSREIANKIISLLSDKDLARKMGINAQLESKKHDVNTYVRKLEEIYDNLVNEARKTA